MEYRFTRTKPDPGDALPVGPSVEKLVMDFLAGMVPPTEPADLNGVLRDYLAGLEGMESPALIHSPSPNAPRAPEASSPAKIELCENCVTLDAGIREQVLCMLRDGIVIPRPHAALCMDAHEIDIVTANPLRCCPGCGHVMNDGIAIEKPRHGHAHDDVCCAGMQRAITRGTVTLRESGLLLRGFLASPALSRTVPFEHCGWCGMWLQLLRHARRLGPSFLLNWNRRHGRLPQ